MELLYHLADDLAAVSPAPRNALVVDPAEFVVTAMGDVIKNKSLDTPIANAEARIALQET